MEDVPEPIDASLLAVLERSRELGFLGPGPVMAHVLHARSYLHLLDETRPLRVLDLGSGGGVPGLVLAHERLDLEVTLLDGMEKRCTFLERAVDDLGLGERVEVVCGRAEEVAHRAERRRRYDAVVARSFASPAVTAECAAGFLRSGGHLIVSEPPGDPAVTRWSADALEQLGLAPLQRWTDGTAHLQVLIQHTECPPRYPRRVGVPAKRPLF